MPSFAPGDTTVTRGDGFLAMSTTSKPALGQDLVGREVDFEVLDHVLTGVVVASTVEAAYGQGLQDVHTIQTRDGSRYRVPESDLKNA